MQPQTAPPRSIIPEEHYDAHYSAPARPRPVRRTRPKGNPAIGGFIAFLIVIIVGVSIASILATGNTAQLISNGVTTQISQLIDGGSNGDAPVDVPPAPVEPAGDNTWVLTEQELNERMARRDGSFGPAENVSFELNEGTVTLRFTAYGVNATYHGSLTARDGAPVVADSRIDGPVGWFVRSSEIDAVLNEEMAAIASEESISVESVHVQPGQVVFGISEA